MDLHKALDALDRPQHTLHAAIAGRRHAWIMRMQRDPDFVFVGDRNNPLQEIGDAFPEHVGGDHARLGQRRDPWAHRPASMPV